MWIFKVSKTESEFFITNRFDVFQENKRKLGCLHYLGDSSSIVAFISTIISNLITQNYTCTSLGRAK